MKIFKLIGLLLAFVSMSNCSAPAGSEQELTGSIGFGVFALSLAKNPGAHGQGLAVAFILKHEESGVVREVNIPFEPNTRIMFIDGLKPGNYTVTEYLTVFGHGQSFNTILKPTLDVEVIANQAVLFPKIVSMSEIYPSAGFRVMDDKAYWQSLMER